MIIETSTLKVEVKDIEQLKENCARTPISDRLAKRFLHKPENCKMWNGNLFVFDEIENTVIVYDYFSKQSKYYKFV